MKKVITISILSLFALGVFTQAFAQTTKPTSNATFLSCMQNAVEKRETSIIGAHNTFHASMSTILGARKTALVDAWKITDTGARNDARKQAWTSYRTDAKSAYGALKTNRHGAWGIYKQDRIVCGAPVTDTTAMEQIGVSM